LLGARSGPTITRLRRPSKSPSTLALALLLGGCTYSAQLVASDGSHRLVGRDSASGITVVVTTESWSGDLAYGEDLTIVHMLVANMGSEPVLLAPGDFELRDGRGFGYVLYDAGGAFQAVPGGDDPQAWAQQEIAYDPGRSNNYESVRTEDAELGRLGLPWGVLLPGTQMRGYVYFEDVRESSNHATLKWHAQTPDHRPIATFGFDLHVARQ
jgi:hypothetical protein